MQQRQEIFDESFFSIQEIILLVWRKRIQLTGFIILINLLTFILSPEIRLKAEIDISIIRDDQIWMSTEEDFCLHRSGLDRHEIMRIFASAIFKRMKEYSNFYDSESVRLIDNSKNKQKIRFIYLNKEKTRNFLQNINSEIINITLSQMSEIFKKNTTKILQDFKNMKENNIESNLENRNKIKLHEETLIECLNIDILDSRFFNQDTNKLVNYSHKNIKFESVNMFIQHLMSSFFALALGVFIILLFPPKRISKQV